MEDAITWDDLGHCTRAYEAWTTSRDEVLAFFDVTRQLATTHYDALWREVRREPDEGGGDPAHEFDRRVGGLWPREHDEILCAASYMFLVAHFEVYLEDAIQEAGDALGFRILPDGNQDGPSFSSLKRFYKKIDIEVETAEVRRIRELRHWVAHRRASIESHELPESLSFDDLRARWNRRVTPEQIKDDADLLDEVIRTADPTMWLAAYCNAPSAALLAIAKTVEAEHPDE